MSDERDDTIGPETTPQNPPPAPPAPRPSETPAPNEPTDPKMSSAGTGTDTELLKRLLEVSKTDQGDANMRDQAHTHAVYYTHLKAQPGITPYEALILFGQTLTAMYMAAFEAQRRDKHEQGEGEAT